MARRYVRDKIGRFASHGGGGGSFGGGGKIGKSAKNVKARAAYKRQAVNVREAKKMAGGKMTTSREQKYWNRQLGGAKSGMTRVTNRLTNKRAAKSGLKETLASQRVAGRKATFKAKTTKGRAAKSEWKAARRADRKGGIGEGRARDRNQKRVIKKQTGKAAYAQGFRETPKFTKAPRAGSKTKVQKIRGKIESKKAANKALRGSEFKGVKKRQSKGEKAVANRKKPERVRARKREEQGLALAGRKAYRKGPGAAERKAAVTGKTMKSTVGRKEKAAYRAKTPEHQRSGVRLKRYGNPYGSHALGGGIQRDRRADHAAKRNVKKRRGAKVYDNTTNTSIKMKTKKRDLKRKYKYGYS